MLKIEVKPGTRFERQKTRTLRLSTKVYLQAGDTGYAGETAALHALGGAGTTRHPADWPAHGSPQHCDARWFCAGGDQLW